MSFFDETQDEDRHPPGLDAGRNIRTVCCATHDLELQEPPAGEPQPHCDSNLLPSGPEVGGPQEPPPAGLCITHDLECPDRDMM